MHAIVLAGGSGSRLWPLSRPDHPKQLLPLVGRESLLLMTLRRTRLQFRPCDTWVVAAAVHRKEILSACRSIPRKNILFEPAARGTAAAVAMAIRTIATHDPKGTFAIINTDQLVHDVEHYGRAIQSAERAHRRFPDQLTLVGVTPAYAETGYGYIELGRSVPGDKKLFEVKRFVEKPDLVHARRYVNAKKFLWNIAMVTGRIATLIAAYERYLPSYITAVTSPRSYRALRPETIDYGILEHMHDLLVVHGTFDWIDVGHWRAVHMALDDGHAKNVTRGRTIVIDGTGNLILNENKKKIIAVVGLADCAIIETPDALLVCPLDRAHDVKKIIPFLKGA